MDAFQRGLVVAAILAVLTIAEYIFAIELENDLVRFIGLAVAAVAKSALIVSYFMHFARLWRTEEAH